MKNSKPKSNIEITRSEVFKKIVNWRRKNEILKDQISKLEVLKDIPIIAIASFLLKTQIIEFELKQLIPELDLHLIFSNNSRVLKRKPRTPNDMNEKRMTLGALKEDLDQFKGEFLEDLQKDLHGVNKLRKQFVHHLFDIGSIITSIEEADRGLKMANKVLENIEEVNSFLERNDPLKELTDKKASSK